MTCPQQHQRAYTLPSALPQHHGTHELPNAPLWDLFTCPVQLHKTYELPATRFTGTYSHPVHISWDL
eukprot:12004353-Karenia_brevis.AAC.1